eukprot:TRINITY_DN29219_c0_g1_i1.p1 TRINITY_DN29219_c0_g1~~TRINITY_DN29219_c0_g1_i1.p1  ORF type:complete len:261 (-),score=22.55 TRINITY_DN29219_c0_g1_i1:127-876(-)
MASKPQLEQAMSFVEEESGDVPDVITIICGSRKFQILERTIRSKGRTVLLDMLEDPGRKDKTAPIYAEGDCERFRHILDWYRFGSLKIPMSISLDEMQRECAFYGLPEDVNIEREGIGNIVAAVSGARKRTREESTNAGAVAAAHAAFDLLLSDESLTRTGKSSITWNHSAPSASKWKDVLVWSAVIGSNWTTSESIGAGGREVFESTLTSLAKSQQFAVEFKGNASTAPSQMTISLVPSVQKKTMGET